MYQIEKDYELEEKANFGVIQIGFMISGFTCFHHITALVL